MGLNPDYALAILLRAKIPAKYEASQLFLNHRSSGLRFIRKSSYFIGLLTLTTYF